MAPNKPTFQQRLCEQSGVAQADFTQIVLRKTLPVHARVLLPFFNIIEENLLAADYDLVNGIAQLTSRREFSDYVKFRRTHPANRGAIRKVFKVRVSISRLHKLVYDVMRPAASSPPWPQPASKDSAAERSRTSSAELAECAGASNF